MRSTGTTELEPIVRLTIYEAGGESREYSRSNWQALPCTYKAIWNTLLAVDRLQSEEPGLVSGR